MKTYESIVNGIRYWYFFDQFIKSWTVFQVDADDCQVGDAEYYANKPSLLSCYKFDFKKCVS